MLEAIRTRGRAKKEVAVDFVRELTEEDLPLLANVRPTAEPQPLIKRLSSRHHAAARLLASGMAPGEVAAVIGYDPSRISILQGDPAFKELVVFYTEKVDAAYMDAHEALASLKIDALNRLHDRVEEVGDVLPPGLLLEIVKVAADRTGQGPASKTETNVNINIGTRLEQARQRVEARRKMIDVTPTLAKD